MRWLNAAAGFLRVAAWVVVGLCAWAWVWVFLAWPLPLAAVGSMALYSGLIVAAAGLLYWLGKWLGSLEAVRSQPLTRKEKWAFELACYVAFFVAAWWFGWLDAMVEGAKQGWEEGWNRP